MTEIIILLIINTFINVITMCLLHGIWDNVIDLYFDVSYLKSEKFIEKYHKTRGLNYDNE